MGLDKLNNTGIRYIGDKKAIEQEQKTLIVIGVVRGGTSLVAGTIDKLGIFTGKKSRPPVYEDVVLAELFEKNNYDAAQKIIDEYNANHDIWLFKRPSVINYIDDVNQLFRNPIYLIIFKDIFSVSNRNSISMTTDTIQGLKKAHDEYSKILSFINKNEINGYLLSYEKIMQNTENFVETMITLLDTDIDETKREKAMRFIEPNPKAYLDASRITKSIGRIGSITKDKIIGWGKYLHSNEVAIVELYINNSLVSSTEAKDFRQHVVDKNIHPTGHCGYYFDLSEFPLKDGDNVSVKLSKDVVFLDGSDFIFKENSGAV